MVLTNDEVRAAIRGLTRAERRHVGDGSIHGDFRMSTVNSLRRKGLFYLRIDSPNGRSGFMELTDLGQACHKEMKRRGYVHTLQRFLTSVAAQQHVAAPERPIVVPGGTQ